MRASVRMRFWSRSKYVIAARGLQALTPAPRGPGARRPLSNTVSKQSGVYARLARTGRTRVWGALAAPIIFVTGIAPKPIPASSPRDARSGLAVSRQSAPGATSDVTNVTQVLDQCQCSDCGTGAPMIHINVNGAHIGLGKCISRSRLRWAIVRTSAAGATPDARVGVCSLLSIRGDGRPTTGPFVHNKQLLVSRTHGSQVELNIQIGLLLKQTNKHYGIIAYVL